MIVLESAVLAAEVLPEIGGKVGQIHWKPGGCDLLVPPLKPYRTIPTEASWLDYDTSGMDDCFPNIAAGPYPLPPHQSLVLPDLGEWTHGSWEVLDAGLRQMGMRRKGDRLPYRAWKRIRFAGEDTLEFLYRVENHGSTPLRYMWSAHPLLRVEQKYKLNLPGSSITYRTFPPDEKVHAWPLWQGIDLSCDWIERGTNLKIFLSGLEEGWCALLLPEYTVRFRFSLGALPLVGVWLNNDGFPARGASAPFRCIGVEPCTSPSDLLDDSDAAAYPVLRPGEVASWTLQMQVVPPEERIGPREDLRNHPPKRPPTRNAWADGRGG